MPSGWTTSGIDWTSVSTMRNSRTEDIVRHLYLAVNERDYWIRYFTTGFKYTTLDINLPSLDRVGRIRLEDAYYYIINTCSNWLTPFDDLLVDSSELTLTNESCFLNPTSEMIPDEIQITGDLYDPFFPSGRWFGLKNLDYLQGGVLEGMVNYDMSILRDKQRGRCDLHFLKFIYDLLNLPLKNAGVLSQKYLNPDINGETDRHLAYFFSAFDNDFYGFSYDRNVVGDDLPSAQDSIDASIIEFNSQIPFYQPQASLRSDSFINCFTRGNGSGRGSIRDSTKYIKYLAKGFDGLQVKMQDLDVNLRSYGRIGSRAGQGWDLYYYLPQGDRGKGENNVIPTVEEVNGLDVIRVSEKIGDNLIPPNAPPNGDKYEDNFSDGTVIPFLNFNKEGFLNYYTE